MSLIPLATAKSFLDVIHSADDAKLQLLLDGAEGEALEFMNRRTFSGPWSCGWVCEPCSELSSESSSEPGEEQVPPSVVVAILMLLSASYQATPDDAEKLRKGAEIKLTPNRRGWGA